MWQLAISSCIDPKGRRPCSAVSGLAAVKFVITDQQSVKSKHPHHSTCALCFKKFSLALEPHVFRLPHPYLNKRRLQGPSGLTETVQYQECCALDMPQTELFWALLEDGHPLEDLKKLNLEGFDWSERRGGTTLLVARIAKALYNSKENDEQALNTIEWLICSGASIEQQCTGGKTKLWLKERPHVPEVELEGLNAISFVQALQAKMRQHLSEWSAHETFLVRVMSCFARASSRASSSSMVGPRVSIHEGIAQLWEKSLAAKDSHDLTIETADGMLTAHAHMLKAASSVVAAMLASPMKEGQAQRIEVKDTSGKAVSLFLEMLGRVYYRTTGNFFLVRTCVGLRGV